MTGTPSASATSESQVSAPNTFRSLPRRSMCGRAGSRPQSFSSAPNKRTASSSTPPTASLQKASVSTRSLISLRIPEHAPEQSTIALVGRFEVNVLVEVLPELPSGAPPSVERLHRHSGLGVVARPGGPGEDDEAGVRAGRALQVRGTIGQLPETGRLDCGWLIASYERPCRIAVRSVLDV